MINKYTVSCFLIMLAGYWILAASPREEEPFIKGMTVSCQTWGYEWATPEMKETMVELRSLGINWISIHPYARIMENGKISRGRPVSNFLCGN